jgi:hypothetical protein
MGAIFAATDSVATLQVLDKDAMPNLFALVSPSSSSMLLVAAAVNGLPAHTPCFP